MVGSVLVHVVLNSASSYPIVRRIEPKSSPIRDSDEICTGLGYDAGHGLALKTPRHGALWNSPMVPAEADLLITIRKHAITLLFNPSYNLAIG